MNECMAKTLRSGQDLNQGHLFEKPIPQTLSYREFTLTQMLGIVYYSKFAKDHFFVQ